MSTDHVKRTATELLKVFDVYVPGDLQKRFAIELQQILYVATTERGVDSNDVLNEVRQRLAENH